MQASLISPQDIEAIVLKFSKLQGDILNSVPAGGPVIGCLIPKNRNTSKFNSGGSEYLLVDKDGALAAKTGCHENHGSDVFFDQEVANIDRGIQRDWFRLVDWYRGKIRQSGDPGKFIHNAIRGRIGIFRVGTAGYGNKYS